MLTTLSHPLAAHLVSHLRERSTPPARFRVLCHQITLLLALEATRTLSTRPARVETPLETHTGAVLAEALAVVAILRAGLGMVQPIVDLFPEVAIGYVGLERDHETARARAYYCKLPPLEGRRVLLVDPMLATGGSALLALEQTLAGGARPEALSLLCVVAAPEGVAEVEKEHPRLPIFAGALDRELNARRYILPGLGDFGDRLYGT